jgi:hypothetical protein
MRVLFTEKSTRDYNIGNEWKRRFGLGRFGSLPPLLSLLPIACRP